jgi:hypothetical protein
MSLNALRQLYKSPDTIALNVSNLLLSELDPSSPRENRSLLLMRILITVSFLQNNPTIGWDLKDPNKHIFNRKHSYRGLLANTYRYFKNYYFTTTDVVPVSKILITVMKYLTESNCTLNYS